MTDLHYCTAETYTILLSNHPPVKTNFKKNLRNFIINLLIIQIFKDISAKYLGGSFKLCVFHTLEVKVPDHNHHMFASLLAVVFPEVERC